MRDLTKEIVHPRKSKTLLWLIVIFLVALLAWSYTTQFGRVVRASGRVIPAANTQIVQNLEGGILTSLLVKEGDNIVRGQVLAQFDTMRFRVLVRESEKKIATLTLRKLRLKNEIDRNNQLRPPKNYLDSYPDLVASERELLLSRLREITVREKNYKKRINLAKKELANLKKFVKTGAISTAELLEGEKKLVNLNIELDNFLASGYKERAEKMAEAVAQIVILRETIKTARDQLARTTVRSPADGTVNQRFFSTVGAVVNPGQTILEIVPDDGEVLVEARVMPKDIGYIVPNMTASLKLTAYDYSIYGTLRGRVVKVGADTVIDKNDPSRQPKYEIKIAIDPDSLAQWRARQMDIRTGMVVEAELEAGSMRIIDYLLRPLLKTRDALSTI